ncbi:restriction endonuclease subunit S [Deltaproteobacteria bacterium TL4]
MRGKEVTERFNGSAISTELFISENKYNEIKNKFGVPEENDILLTSVGTLGNPYLVEKNFKFYFKDGNLTWFRNYKGIYPKWLFYWIVSPQGKETLTHAKIGSTQQAFTIVSLKQLPIILPPLPEQKAIASVLSALDDKIELLREQNKSLEALAQTLFKRWFVDFNFPDENEEPYKDSGGKMIESELGEIPEGWRVGKFTDIAEILSGGTPKTNIEEYWNGNIPFFTPKDAKDSFYVLETEKSITETGLSKCNSHLYPKNTVFITARGTVGKCTLAACDMAMNQSCYALMEQVF